MEKIIAKQFLVGEVDSFAVQTKPLSLWSEKKKGIFQSLAKKHEICENPGSRKRKKSKFSKHIKPKDDCTDWLQQWNHVHKLLFFLLQMMKPYSLPDQMSWILEWFLLLTAFQKYSEMLQCYVQQPQKSITSWKVSR